MLDEASASVDAETDHVLQRMLKRELHDVTMLTIAHRLQTIAHDDRILVLSHGRCVEYDSPERLLADKGAFFAMVSDATHEVETKEELTSDMTVQGVS